MGQRIRLANGAAIGAAALPSVRIRLADPPFSFIGLGGYTGNVTIEESVDDNVVTDANATWISLGTVSSGATFEWKDPLFRVRANPSATTGTGSVTVQMLEGVRSLKNERLTPRPSGTRRQAQQRNGMS
jgi:hypothetical protein